MRKKITVFVIVFVLLTVQMTEVAFGASLAKVSLTASQSTQTSISLKWDKVSGADGYQVYRATSKNGTYKRIKTITSGSTTSYKNTGLTTGKTYYYKVRAYQNKGSGKTYGSYSSVKSVKLTYTKPKYSVYVPTVISKSNGTIIISITNNSKSENAYFDGNFAIEEFTDDGVVLHTANHISYERADTGVTGTLKTSRLTVKPGEKVRFKCQLDETWDYDRTKIRVTTVVHYKKQDYVGVYSIDEGNQIFTVEDYYDYLI